MPDYRWAESSGRFRDERGRYASERTVRAVVDQVVDAASQRMQTAATALLEGRLSLGAWQSEMQAAIKLAHTSAAVLAHGGAEQMTQARWGAVGRAVRDEYAYLKVFADQITQGGQPLNGALVARAAQYGQGGRITFERARRRDQQDRGYTEERNMLGAADHCSLCPELSARGWVPIGSLPPIGRRPCRSNDRCRLEYRKDAQEVAA